MTDISAMLKIAQALQRAPAQVQPVSYGDGDIQGVNRDYAIADALSQQGYIPNSGALGALAQLASAFAGYKVGQRADKKANEIGAAQRAAEAAAKEQAKREEAEARAAEEARKIAAVQGAGLTPEQAQAAVVGGLSIKDIRPEVAQPKYFKMGNQLVTVGADGKPSVAYSAPAAAAKEAPPISALGKELQAAVDAGLVSAEEAAAVRRQKLGIVDQEKSAKPLSAKDAAAAATRRAAGESLLGSIDNAERMLREGEVSTGPIAGRLSGLLQSDGAQVYNAEIGGIVAELRRLQKTPGSGADSDKELEILLKQAPSLVTDEDAAITILQRLREKAQIYGAGGGASGGWSIEEVQ